MDEILNLIESVSEGFPSYFSTEYYCLFLALVDQILIVFIICVNYQHFVLVKVDKLL